MRYLNRSVSIIFVFFLVCVSANAQSRLQCDVQFEADFDIKRGFQPERLDVLPTTQKYCGFETNFYYGLNDALQTRLVNGKPFSFIPVYLHNKDYKQQALSETRCYATNVVPACVTTENRPDGGINVTLTRNRRGEGAVVIKVDRDHKIEYPAGNADLFIIPKTRSSFDALRERIRKYECRSRYCEHEKLYAVEWYLIDTLRIMRRIKLSNAEDKGDFLEFLRSVDAALAGRKKVIHTFIIANEIGNTTPYGLIDAVIAESGLSFGAHQIDLGGNSTADIGVFRAAIDDAYGKSESSEHKSLISRINAGVYYRPLRRFRVAELSTLYNLDWRPMTIALRAPSARDRYNKKYIEYLEREDATYQNLVGSEAVVRRYPWTGFLLIDTKNQYGGFNESLVQLKSLAAQNLRRQLGALTFEEDNGLKQKILDWKLLSKYGRENTCDLLRRYIIVMDAVSIHMPDLKNRRYFQPSAAQMERIGKCEEATRLLENRKPI